MPENPLDCHMTKPLLLALAFFLIVSSLACAQEVAYAYGESGGRPLESGNITDYNGTDMVTSVIAGGGSALQGTGMTVDEMKREIDLKLNVPNQVVDDKAGSLVLDPIFRINVPQRNTFRTPVPSTLKSI